MTPVTLLDPPLSPSSMTIKRWSWLLGAFPACGYENHIGSLLSPSNVRASTCNGLHLPSCCCSSVVSALLHIHLSNAIISLWGRGKINKDTLISSLLHCRILLFSFFSKKCLVNWVQQDRCRQGDFLESYFASSSGLHRREEGKFKA